MIAERTPKIAPKILPGLSLNLYNFKVISSKDLRNGCSMGFAEIAVPVEVLLDLGATSAAFLRAAQEDSLKALTGGVSNTAREIAANLTNVSRYELPKFSGVRLPVVWNLLTEQYGTIEEPQAEFRQTFPPRVVDFVDRFIDANNNWYEAIGTILEQGSGSRVCGDFRYGAASAIVQYVQEH
jgi:hypothetical protein